MLDLRGIVCHRQRIARQSLNHGLGLREKGLKLPADVLYQIRKARVAREQATPMVYTTRDVAKDVHDSFAVVPTLADQFVQNGLRIVGSPHVRNWDFVAQFEGLSNSRRVIQ